MAGPEFSFRDDNPPWNLHVSRPLPGMANASALNYDSRSLDNFTTWFKMEISPLREMTQINFSVRIGAFVKPHHFFDVRK